MRGKLFAVVSWMSLALCVAASAMWVTSAYLIDRMQWYSPAGIGFDFDDGWVAVSFRGGVDVYPLWPAAVMLGIVPLLRVAISARSARVGRIAGVVAGAAGGFLFAAGLPVWPALYADIGREGPLWGLWRFFHPYPSLSAYAFPLCGMAAFVALGEIGARRWVERIRRKRALRRTGECPTCSYCLTGNTSGVCPECGSPVPRVSRTA